jgi:hypothetical protein
MLSRFPLLVNRCIPRRICAGFRPVQTTRLGRRDGKSRTGSILLGMGIASTRSARRRATHAPSPDVRYAHPGLRLLDADCASQSASASPSWLRWSATPAPGAWVALRLRLAGVISFGKARGSPCPKSRARRQAQPGWRSAAGVQRAQGRMPVANVRRWGMGYPVPVGQVDSWCRTGLGQASACLPAFWHTAPFRSGSCPEGFAASLYRLSLSASSFL